VEVARAVASVASHLSSRRGVYRSCQRRLVICHPFPNDVIHPTFPSALSGREGASDFTNRAIDARYLHSQTRIGPRPSRGAAPCRGGRAAVGGGCLPCSWLRASVQTNPLKLGLPNPYKSTAENLPRAVRQRTVFRRPDAPRSRLLVKSRCFNS
jgi:hypothetical protein